MKYIVLVGLMLVAFGAASENIYPPLCTPLVVKDDTVTMSAEKPAVAMIHNLSTMDLWITHPVTEPNASAGWSSRLQAGNWSALAMDGQPFELSCIESRPGHEQQVPCAGALAICQWLTVTMPEKSTGTFWAGEDMSLAGLTAHLGSRGFVVPTPAQ